MISTFPAPVLSIAADVVRDLEGGEALFNLWKLFTKCKESLQDGQRLENISWRMWHREMTTTNSYRPLTPETSSSAPSESRKDFPFFQPVDRKQMCHDELLQPRVSSFIAGHPQHDCPSSPSEQSPIPSSSLSLHWNISFGHSEPSPPIGKFIVDILPHSKVSHFSNGSCLNALPHPNVTVPPVPLPTVCLPSTPPPSDAAFPRVVVVNPTPHPTPPATPVMNHSSPPLHNQLRSTHLLPPPLSPMLVNPPSSIKEKVSPNAPLFPPRIFRPSNPGVAADEMLKASDRRFFLQQSPERESPERDGSTDGGKVSDIVEASSGGSSQMHVRGSAESDRPTGMKGTRKGKEVVRHVGMTRTAARRGLIAKPVAKRQLSLDKNKHKPTFNIGSSSSNGSKGVRNGSESSSKLPPPPTAKETTPPKRTISPVKATQAQGRRIVVTSSASSDYETTDTDDDSWCSEEMSAEENEKTKEENRLREAALEAQRQRDMFAKVPKRSYSNLNRTRSGLLSALLNPDPNIFPPSHPYRTSYSSQDVTQLPRRNVTAGFTPMPPLTTSKSSAALPQAARITARVPSINDQDSGANEDAGYQPKGRPQGQEMELDTESDDENPDDRIQVSRSIAQERLAALVGRRNFDRTQSSRLPQPAPVRPSLSTVNSTPIPFGHPYNLPAPAPPSTPRTTRRQMLATELSESLRRNLLWERQVSKNLAVGQRRKSTTALGGIQPLTSTTTAGGLPRNDGVERSTSHQGGNEAAAKEERKRRAMARNRSWADDYHIAGW